MEHYVYGVDVGGTTIKIGLFNFDSMTIVDHYEIKTPSSNHKATIFKTIYENLVKSNKEHNISFKNVLGIGIDVPCPVKEGYVKDCANINFTEIDLIKEIKKYVPSHVQIVTGNDATIAAFGENASLVEPFKNAVLITLGTGVGGGIILDGKIVEGTSGLAGEIGHIRVFNEDIKTCGCGSKGCLEQICGTNGILEYTKELMLIQQSSLEVNSLTVKKIFDAAKEGDEVALKTVDRVAKYIGIAASILAVVIEPEVFIIGGGISKSGNFLIDFIEKHYKENARFTTGEIPFKLAKTGNLAGIIGTAILAKEKVLINKNL